MMMVWAVVSHISYISRDAKLTCGTDGFFDAGMLLQALKKDKEPPPAEQIAARRKSVGKRLALTEY